MSQYLFDAPTSTPNSRIVSFNLNSSLQGQQFLQQLHQQQTPAPTQSSLSDKCCASCGTHSTWRWYHTPLHGQECNACYRHYQRKGQRRSLHRSSKRDSQTPSAPAPVLSEQFASEFGDSSVDSTAYALMALADYEPPISISDSNPGYDMAQSALTMDAPPLAWTAASAVDPVTSLFTPIFPMSISESDVLLDSQQHIWLDPRPPTVSPLTPPEDVMFSSAGAEQNKSQQMLEPKQQQSNACPTTVESKVDSASAVIRMKKKKPVGRRPRTRGGKRSTIAPRSQETNAAFDPAASAGPATRMPSPDSFTISEPSGEVKELVTINPDAPDQLPPMEILPHGSSIRVYLNQHVTPTLIEGVKWLAANQPPRPLEWLGQYLLTRSKDFETTAPHFQHE